MDFKSKIEEEIKMFGETPRDKNLLRIMHYKKYLQETDYAIIKMYENAIQGGSILEMLKEYTEILKNRKEARELINELEKSLVDE